MISREFDNGIPFSELPEQLDEVMSRASSRYREEAQKHEIDSMLHFDFTERARALGLVAGITHMFTTMDTTSQAPINAFRRLYFTPDDRIYMGPTAMEPRVYGVNHDHIAQVAAVVARDTLNGEMSYALRAADIIGFDRGLASKSIKALTEHDYLTRVESGNRRSNHQIIVEPTVRFATTLTRNRKWKARILSQTVEDEDGISRDEAEYSLIGEGFAARLKKHAMRST